jgi:hypothetical protein
VNKKNKENIKENIIENFNTQIQDMDSESILLMLGVKIMLEEQLQENTMSKKLNNNSPQNLLI